MVWKNAAVFSFLILTSCVNRGACLKSHVERRPAWSQFILSGRVLVPIYHPARDEVVCDRWEYPNGKTKDSPHAQ